MMSTSARGKLIENHVQILLQNLRSAHLYHVRCLNDPMIE